MTYLLLTAIISLIVAGTWLKRRLNAHIEECLQRQAEMERYLNTHVVGFINSQTELAAEVDKIKEYLKHGQPDNPEEEDAAEKKKKEEPQGYPW